MCVSDLVILRVGLHVKFLSVVVENLVVVVVVVMVLVGIVLGLRSLL